LKGAGENTLEPRSATHPNKWWRIEEDSSRAILDNYQCKSKQKRNTFKTIDLDGMSAVQSQKNENWLNIKGNNRLTASLDNPNANAAAVFILRAVGQPNSQTNPNSPSPAPRWLVAR